MSTETFIVSVVMVKDIPTGRRTINKLYPIDAASVDEAHGKAVAQAQAEFPDGYVHTFCSFRVTPQTCNGKTAQQWHDDWLLCATGRQHEWEQLCYLTKHLAPIAEGLKASGKAGNIAAKRAYRRLNQITQKLWLTHPEKCVHRLPKVKLP